MDKDESLNYNDFDVIENLANMESRITVIENKLTDLQISNNDKRNVLTKDCIIYHNEKYVCMKFIKKEECVVQNKIRKIGFDICFSDNNICRWVLKIE